MRRFLTLSALAATLALAAPAAEAGFVPVLVSPTGAASSNTFVYNLNFTTSAALPETLNSGDFLTLYDFDAGVTSAAQVVVAPGGLLAVTVQNVGTTPPGGLVNPTDNPGIANITFTYTGPTLVVDTTFVATITTVGGPYFGTRVGQYTTTDTIGVQGDNNQIGAVLLPIPVPEPASVALLGLGGLGFGLIARRRLRVARD